MIYSMFFVKNASSALSSELFVVWLIMGTMIYVSYGYRKNRKIEALAHTTIENKEIAKENEFEESIK